MYDALSVDVDDDHDDDRCHGNQANRRIFDFGGATMMHRMIASYGVIFAAISS